MSVTDARLPAYCTREQVKAALDVKQTARNDSQVDRAIDSASRSVEGLLRRVFYPAVDTRYFDWPNYDYAYPWRLWLNQNELAATPTSVTSGTTAIASAQVFVEPVNSGPPYTSIELDRSSSAAFGSANTPQRDVAIAGTFGYWTKTATAGALAAAMTDTTGMSATVTDGSLIGVGDLISVGTERMVVIGKAMTTTAQTLQSGLSTAASSDVSLGVTDGTKYAVGEVLLLDSERVLIVDIASNTLTVKRAWDGTVLAAHTGSTIYAGRLLSVTRGALGTAAATHSNAAAVTVAVVPGLVRDLALAEAVNQVTQEAGGYARTQGSGSSVQSGMGAGLDDLRDRAIQAFGRKARTRVI